MRQGHFPEWQVTKQNYCTHKIIFCHSRIHSDKLHLTHAAAAYNCISTEIEHFLIFHPQSSIAAACIKHGLTERAFRYEDF